MLYKSLTIGDATNLNPVLEFISELFYVHIDRSGFIEVTDNKMLEVCLSLGRPVFIFVLVVLYVMLPSFGQCAY